MPYQYENASRTGIRNLPIEGFHVTSLQQNLPSHAAHSGHVGSHKIWPKGRTIRLQGGGAGSLGQDKFFFSSSLARKVFFYFQYLMGQVFFLALDGASFFFFLIKFVFNTHFQMKLR